MKRLMGWKPYTPPKGTVPTMIHDIYGEGILVYSLPEDKESPQRLENAIRQSQLSGGKSKMKGDKNG